MITRDDDNDKNLTYQMKMTINHGMIKRNDLMNEMMPVSIVVVVVVRECCPFLTEQIFGYYLLDSCLLIFFKRMMNGRTGK